MEEEAFDRFMLLQVLEKEKCLAATERDPGAVGQSSKSLGSHPNFNQEPKYASGMDT